MKLILETTYDNVDQEFLNWWLKHNGPNYGIQTIYDLPASIQSHDPMGLVTGKTSIKLIKDEQ